MRKSGSSRVQRRIKKRKNMKKNSKKNKKSKKNKNSKKNKKNRAKKINRKLSNKKFLYEISRTKANIRSESCITKFRSFDLFLVESNKRKALKVESNKEIIGKKFGKV